MTVLFFKLFCFWNIQNIVRFCVSSARFSKLCFASVHPVSASPLPFLSYFPVNQQYDGCFVPLAWMLMVGLQGFASNGKILLT